MTSRAKGGAAARNGLVTVRARQARGAYDYITWISEQSFRYWIHSRVFESQRAQFSSVLSFEIEYLDVEAIEKPPTNAQLESRIEVAVQRSTPAQTSSINSSEFRKVAIGGLLEKHSKMILKTTLDAARRPQSRLSLVNDFETNTFVAEVKVFRADEQRSKPSIGASKREALLVATLYSQRVEMGVAKPAKSVAEKLDVNVSSIYTAIRIARRNSWLTSNGSGVGGGVLTEVGKNVLRSFKDDKEFQGLIDMSYLSEKIK